jgi:polyisoprenoid-binding protein YceI
MKQFFILLFFICCGNAHAQLADGNYPLVIAESQITWKVDYSVGKSGHAGTMSLISGSILMKGGVIQGGNFIIDMNSVYVTDIKPDNDGKKGLEDHLKGDDFLATATHPKGYFTVIKSVTGSTPEKPTVTGYLILKGISNTIEFPIAIIDSKNSITIKSVLTIDRTKWGINYQSGSIFGTLKDDMISDEMNITLNLIFKKAE